MEIVVDIVESQEGILFVTGYVEKSITVGELFNVLTVYQLPKKKKQKPKKLSAMSIELTVETILVDGEPLEVINVGQTAQLGLTGDAEPILALMSEHQWHNSNGRYFLPRKETRLITLSGE